MGSSDEILEDLTEYLQESELTFEELVALSNTSDYHRRLLAQLSNLSEYYDYIYEDFESEYHLALTSTITAYVLMATAVFGILTNVYVFWKLGTIIRAKPYLNPAVVLRCMCAADIFCLLFSFSYTTGGESVLRNERVSVLLKQIACKTFMYSVHVASAFSVWCWMTLSAQRYIAIVRPLLYRRYSSIQQPSYFLVRLGLIFVIIEFWMFIVTDYSETVKDCRERPENLTSSRPHMIMHILQVMDICLTYLLPVIIMLCMDISVRRSHKKRAAVAQKINGGSKMLQLNGLNGSPPPVPSAIIIVADGASVDSAPSQFAGRTASFSTQEVEVCGCSESGGTLNRCYTDRSPSKSPVIELLYNKERLSAINEESRSIKETDRPSPDSCLLTDAPHDTGGCHAQGTCRSNLSAKSGSSYYTSDMSSCGQSARRERKQRSTKMLRRYLLLSSLDIALNLPRILLRLVPVFGGDPPVSAVFLHYFTLVSYITYYAQHSINILYIWVLYPSLMKKFSK